MFIVAIAHAESRPESGHEITRLKWISQSNQEHICSRCFALGEGTLLPRYGSVLSRKLFQARKFLQAICPFALLAAALCAPHASAQSPTQSPYYARANTLGIFGAYSADSSHMLLGDAEHRMLLNIGVTYNRRLHLGNI